jgi:glycosyltransferase involved in cell wall biosynthesis
MSYAPPTPFHHTLNRRLETSVLREADRVVVTSESTREDFCALVPGIEGSKVITITNGFDEDDFASAETWLAGADADCGPKPLLDCPVLHAGQLNPERPLDAYLAGLRLFLERSDAPTRSAAHTLFLGGHYDADVVRVRESGLAESVVFAPSRPHRESVGALLSARVLLLLEQDSPRGGLILPGKIFEYLRSGRPILAVVPVDGAAARLVRDLDAGFVADPKRPEMIAEGLGRLLSGVDAFVADTGRIAAFERRRLTQRLAGELDAIS